MKNKTFSLAYLSNSPIMSVAFRFSTRYHSVYYLAWDTISQNP